MISKEEIKKLADLARIDIAEKEQEKLAGEMDVILDYISQIKGITGEADLLSHEQDEIINVMRADENPTASENHGQALIAEFPDKEGDYLKVKKIL